MSERPAAVTASDEILLYLCDQVEILIGLVGGRGGAPADDADAPADNSNDDTTTTVVDEPAPTAKATAKKTTSRAKKPVEGL